VDGDRLVITDVKGKETPFVIRISGTRIPSLKEDSQTVAISNTDELIHIRLLEGTSARLQISDVSGKKMVSQKIGKSFDYSLLNGIYVIEIEDDKDNSVVVKYVLR
ncbi:MAG: T9SS type A sorting domain-containing protein, partial [Dysgonamonadaceae bacterium]|nr:T9SS type A sorting domain-containing protein [Dysgonamonadaceae bacterium]